MERKVFQIEFSIRVKCFQVEAEGIQNAISEALEFSLSERKGKKGSSLLDYGLGPSALYVLEIRKKERFDPKDN